MKDGDLERLLTPLGREGPTVRLPTRTPNGAVKLGGHTKRSLSSSLLASVVSSAWPTARTPQSPR